MRIHPHALRAMTFATALSFCVAPRSADEDVEAKPESPPEPKPQPERLTNRPGETNRQFAARMAQRKPNDPE